MSSIGVVWDRMSSVVVAQGYVRTADPFDFDFQPDTKLDHVFHLRSSRVGTEGYIGGDQGETHRLSIFLAQRAKRDAWGAARQLKVDMDLIEAVLLGDETNETFGYFVLDDGVQSESQLPAGGEADFVVGKIDATILLDRLL